MPKGFYWILSAQFLSSLADNALLLACIKLLLELQSPEWMPPLLKVFFSISYVVFAAFVGAFADTMPKGRVMLITNLVKLAGLIMLLLGVEPIMAYCVVGLGAAAYSPAKYGILTELLPPEKLVLANGWIEGLTVLSIISGVLIGGLLVSETLLNALLDVVPAVLHHLIYSPARNAIFLISLGYIAAALCNLKIPDTGIRYPKSRWIPQVIIGKFAFCVKTLWADKLGQIALAVTTLFWGAGATMQFIIIDWAQQDLGMNLSQAAVLQALVAVGITIGSFLAAKYIPLKQALKVLPFGVYMGLGVIAVIFVSPDFLPAVKIFGIPLPLVATGLLLIIIGLFAGIFVVPVNALLQHRGFVLLTAGQSISVQNFNENLSILVMLALYSSLIGLALPLTLTIVIFGLSVAVAMLAIIQWHRLNMRERDWTQDIGLKEHSLGLETKSTHQTPPR